MIIRLAFLLLFLSSFSYGAAVLYVSPAGAHVPPFSDWATAFTNIQSAVNSASAGDSIVVSDGTYLLDSEITVNRSVRIQSVNGPASTIIDGQGQTRCFNLTSGGSLIGGFTIRNGYTTESGGGILCVNATAVVSNCVVTGNHALHGGGIHGGSAYRCSVLNNEASRVGGGVHTTRIYDSLVCSNWYGWLMYPEWMGGEPTGGGGMYEAIAVNCTLVGNRSSGADYMWYYKGSGASESTLINCVIDDNLGIGYVFGPDFEVVLSTNEYNLFSCVVSNSCSPDLTAGVNGNITDQPLLTAGFRLSSNSPCVNWGNTAYVSGAADLDGSPRVIETYVDMGCYEFQAILGLDDADGDGLPDAWEQLHFSGNADPAMDGDGDGQTNGDEFIADTLPMDSGSFFAITNLGLSGAFFVEWPSVTGRYYSVWWSTNLLDGFELLQAGLTYPEGSYTDSVHDAANQVFYRVKVALTPWQDLSMDGMVRVPSGTNHVFDPDFGENILVVDAPFYMDAAEVTYGEWVEVYDWAVANGYHFTTNTASGQTTDHPVVWVNWFDCAKWCNARSERSGKTPCYSVSNAVYRSGDYEAETDYSADGFRMPTLVEWEYAARGGYSAYRYPWGDSITTNDASYLLTHSTTAGTYAPNAYGLYDMVGNVWEWCDDVTEVGKRARSSGGYDSTASYLRIGIHRAGPSQGATGNAWSTLGFRAVCRPQG
ncbi:MAG: SUMF1/EgtB/PvdO family nonheme iron enzyme [Pontiellaceae bacterium]|nr:SUMF1/EgtB/PvdO family nonheme iron enzyme [Pontiellaceae bacterium]MBN2785950.1 SUMF1/EgtB/PvdO family nonheme iron enzyme [Pontiellaceae bacterium]